MLYVALQYALMKNKMNKIAYFSYLNKYFLYYEPLPWLVIMILVSGTGDTWLGTGILRKIQQISITGPHVDEVKVEKDS